MRLIFAMIRKDLQLFVTDRRAVIMTLVAPIAIASFFGSIFSGVSDSERAKIPIAVVDQDNSAISKGILDGARKDTWVSVTTPSLDEAQDSVKKGKTTVAVVIPAGFGDAAGRAFFSGSAKPELTMMYDPSHSMELGLVRGVLTQHVMESVSAEMFTGVQGQKVVEDTLAQLDSMPLQGEQTAMLRDLLQSARKFYSAPAQPAPGATAEAAPRRGLSMPYSVKEQAMTANSNAEIGRAHV